MNEKKDKLIPKLCFPEFSPSEGWESLSLADIIHTVTPPKKLRSFNYHKSGKYPIIDQSQAPYCGYSDDEEALINSEAGDMIVFGDHTCVIKYVDFPFVQGADGIKIFYSKDASRVDTRFLYYYLRSIPLSSDEYKRHFSDLKEKIIQFPSSIIEQMKIASFFSSLDDLLAGTKAKLERLKAHKKGLTQKLFPAPGKTLPEYRFPGFEEGKAWEVKCLGDVTTLVNRRNKSRRILPIYSINNKQGFILQSEQFSGLDSSSRGYDTSLYKIVNSNLFAYNPARINVGSIGYSGRIKEGIISSLYVCFKSSDAVLDDFLRCFFETDQFRRSVDNNVEGGIRNYLFYENFSRIMIALPTIDEQKHIASSLRSINDLIEKYENELVFIENHRQGLMQQLFPKNTL